MKILLKLMLLILILASCTVRADGEWIPLGKNLMTTGGQEAYLSSDTYNVNGNIAYFMRYQIGRNYFYRMYVIPCAKNSAGYQLFSEIDAIRDGDYYHLSDSGWSNGVIMPNMPEAAIAKIVCQ
ncbi:MAG: hypothetical protein ACRESI_01200 [Gammaproteobacteria bacterium]